MKEQQMKVHSEGTAYAFCLTRTRTGARTHLGVDVGHPSMAAGHPRMTLCGHRAEPLAATEDPWTGIADVECLTCLRQAPRYMKVPGWPSLAAARAIFRRVHERKARQA